MILNDLFDLMVCFIQSDFMTLFFYPYFCLNLIALIPVLIKWLTAWR